MEALAISVFLLVAMSVAGAVHVIWLRTDLCRSFGWPVDGGLTLRGRRLFGDNKRVCGFMVLPPMAAITFMGLGGGREFFPSFFSQALWPLTVWQYAGLGLICGFVFMLAELPNSFLKRQLGVAPGQLPVQRWLRPIVILVDRLDSVLGVLLVISLLLPVPLATWLLVLVLGAMGHAAFSIAMHRLGVKPRAL